MDGSAGKLRDFLNETQYTAREADERIRATQLTGSGGPETKAAAQVALESPPELLHDFIEVGQYAAARMDNLTATHVAAMKQLIAQASAAAATAHVDAAHADIVASKAEDDADKAAKAAKAADQANKSAGKAKDFELAARAFAKDAETSANRAAQSAKTATQAANAAKRDADAAAAYASQAQASASWARSSADSAYAAADDARASARQAGKDAEAANTASEGVKERVKYLQDKEYREEQARKEEERRKQEEADKRAAADRKAKEIEAQAREKKKDCPWHDPRCYGGFIGAVLDFSGAKDIYGCFADPSILGCSLAIAQFTPVGKFAKGGAKLLKSSDLVEKIGGKVRSLLSGCRCFLAGTKVLMADRSGKNIEDVQPNDRVLATDPATGNTAIRKVTDHIVTDDDKHFNELTIATPDGPKKLTATDEHPFWSPSAHRWLRVTDHQWVMSSW